MIRPYARRHFRLWLRTYGDTFRQLPEGHWLPTWIRHLMSRMGLTSRSRCILRLWNSNFLSENWYVIQDIDLPSKNERARLEIHVHDQLCNIQMIFRANGDLMYGAQEGAKAPVPATAKIDSYEALEELCFAQPKTHKNTLFEGPDSGETPPRRWRRLMRGQNKLYFLNRDLVNPVLYIMFGCDLSLLPSAYRPIDSHTRSLRSQFKPREIPDFQDLEEHSSLLLDSSSSELAREIDKARRNLLDAERERLYEVGYNEAISGLHSKDDLIKFDDEIEDLVESYVETRGDEAEGEALELALLGERSVVGTLAQQYVNQSNMLDLTTSIETAMFFAGSNARSAAENGPVSFEASTEAVFYVILFREMSTGLFEPRECKILKDLSKRPERIGAQQAVSLYCSEEEPNLAVSRVEFIAEISRDVYLRYLSQIGAQTMKDVYEAHASLECKFFPSFVTDEFYRYLLVHKYVHAKEQTGALFELSCHEELYKTPLMISNEEKHPVEVFFASKQEYWNAYDAGERKRKGHASRS